MHTIPSKTRLLGLGITLILVSVPFLFYPEAVQESKVENQTGVLEFTDVRIVTLDFTISHNEVPLTRRVTVQTDFNSPSPWCWVKSPLYSLCPYPIGDEKVVQGPMINHWGIPLL